MYTVFMIDYLHAIFPQWGVFECEKDARDWIDRWATEETKAYYKPFRLTVNKQLARNVATDCPEHKYANQR